MATLNLKKEEALLISYYLDFVKESCDNFEDMTDEDNEWWQPDIHEKIVNKLIAIGCG
jgi:hypothetical protein